MDTRRFIISMIVVMAIFAGWQMMLGYLDKRHPEWHLVTPASQPAEESTASSSQPTTAAIATATTGPAVGSGGGFGGLTVSPAAAAAPSVIGSQSHADKRYPMALTINPIGAGLDSAMLNDFYASTDKNSPLYSFQRPLGGDEAQSRALASREIIVSGKPVDLSTAVWTPVPSNGAIDSQAFTATIVDGGKPILQIEKTYRLFPRNTSDGSQGWEVGLSQTFHNLTAGPLTLQSTLNGPTLPPRESDRSDDRGFVGGYDDERAVVDSVTPVTYFSTSHPDKDLVTADKRPLLWAGASSAYFDAIVRPDYTGETAKDAIRISAVPVTAYNADAESLNDRSAVMALQSAEFTVAPQGSSSLNFKVFLGPKKRELLKNDYYSAYPRGYNVTLIASEGYCGFLTFQPLITLLYGILWLFHFIFRDWGLAIIGLVVLVRVILHPITRKSQVNMLQMGKMGPELERLKKKYGDDKDELNKAMMQFYKEQGFTPILGCLPMVLQMPIWIALWSALQSTFELRQAPFLRFGWLHLTWIKDLSHPDALVHFNTPISLPFGWHLYGINFLPILMGVAYFLQQKMAPQPVATSPEQEQQRKMMQWMTLLFPLMLYAGPSGLNLYILTSAGIGAAESKIIRDHIKQREEAERAGRIIVDAKPTRAAKRRDGKQTQDPPKGGVMRWLADLQAKAEEIRREAERKGR